MSYFIGICGNIGSGKTTLCHHFSSYEDVTIVDENVDGNNFLAKFYEDMPAWALRSQLKFLIDRHSAAQRAEKARFIFEDRCLHEDIYVFAATLFEQNIMKEEDWILYKQIADIFINFHPRYDLLIYLTASVPTLFRRTVSRGRLAEKDLASEYIGWLQTRYETMMDEIRTTIPVFHVNTELVDLRQPGIAKQLFNEAVERLQS